MSYNFRSGVHEDYRRTLIISAIGLFIIGALLGFGISSRYFSVEKSSGVTSISDTRDTNRDEGAGTTAAEIGENTVAVTGNIGSQDATTHSGDALQPSTSSGQNARQSTGSAPIAPSLASSSTDGGQPSSPLPVGGRGGDNGGGSAGDSTSSGSEPCACQSSGAVGGLLNTVTDTTTDLLNTVTSPLTSPTP